MHTEQLRYFCLVYKYRHFAAAAKRIPMSAQGLAKSMHSLENELGVPLFITDKSDALLPTAYAEDLLLFANDFKVRYEKLCKTFDSIRCAEKQQMRIGASLGIIGLLGQEMLDGFMRSNPHIDITSHEDHDLVCENKLSDDIYDLALTLAPFNPEFETIPLFVTRVFFWVPSNNPLSRKDCLMVSDLADEVIAIPGEGFKCYERLLEECRANNVRCRQIIQSAEIFWIFRCALDGDCLGFALEPHTSLPMFANNALTALPLTGMYWSVGISHIKARTLKPHEQAFVEYICNYIKNPRTLEAIAAQSLVP